MTKRVISLVAIFTLLLSSFLYACDSSEEKPLSVEDINFEESSEYINNPYMGFVRWANDTEETNMDFSLVYVNILWDEIEKEEGQYDFDFLESKYNFDYWRSQNKKAIFRVVLDRPQDDVHKNIPDWLYEKTKDGKFYDVSYGKGYCPDYSNVALQEAHQKLIEALATKYVDDDFLAFIELGSIGHWGEWHISDEVGLSLDLNECYKYVKQYIDAFPNTKLLMRRPFEIAKENNLGLYNDSWCRQDETKRFIDWINNGGDYEGIENALLPMPNVWKVSPIGGEISSLIDREKALSNIDEIINDFKSCHVTFVGPGNWLCEDLNEEQIENENEIAKSLGYRLYISSVYKETFKDYENITLSLDNAGVAPLYYDKYKIFIKYKYKESDEGEEIEKIVALDEYDITKVTSEDPMNIEFTVSGKVTDISVAIMNNDKTEGIYLVNGTQRDGYFQKLI